MYVIKMMDKNGLDHTAKVMANTAQDALRIAKKFFPLYRLVAICRETFGK